MSSFIDLTGMKFNKLTVIKRVENNKRGQAMWECSCDCGNTTIVNGYTLRNGGVKSCGCLNHVPKTKTHGMTNTSLYHIWAGMKQRCLSAREGTLYYKNYMSRGITICDEWVEFEPFMEWAFSNGYKPGLTIERIDVDGNYCPENCTWIPFKEQASNRRSNLMIEYNGKTMSLKAWCDELGLDYKRTHNRIKKLGMNPEEAFTQPVCVNKRNKRDRKKYE